MLDNFNFFTFKIFKEFLNINCQLKIKKNKYIFKTIIIYLFRFKNKRNL